MEVMNSTIDEESSEKYDKVNDLVKEIASEEKRASGVGLVRRNNKMHSFDHSKSVNDLTEKRRQSLSIAT